MHKLRIKKKIAKSQKVLDPIFSIVPPAQSAVEKVPVKEDAKKEAAPTPPVEKAKEVTKPKRALPKIPSIGISINSTKPDQVKNDQEAGNDATESKESVLSSNFTEKELLLAWKELVNEIPPSKVILKQSIKASTPKLVSPTQFEIVVSNTFQEERVHENGQFILSFLHSKLQNNAIKMKVEVSKSVETTKVFTSSDKFKLMMEQNPALEKFRKRLDLELD